MTSPKLEEAHPVTLESPASAWERMTGETPGQVQVTLLRPLSLGQKRVKLYAFKVDGLIYNCSVIALRCRVGRVASERRLFSEVLPGIGVSAPRSFGWTPDPDPGMAWHFIEFLNPWDPTLSPESNEAAMAQWVGSLHARGGPRVDDGLDTRDADHFGSLLARAIADLEAMMDPLRAIGGPLETAGVVPLLAQLQVIQARWPDLFAELSSMPQTLVHGDLKPANVGVRLTSGKAVLVPYDWENAGRGPIAVDLWVPSVQRNPHSYLAHLNGAFRITRRELDRMVELGELLRAIDAIGWVAVADTPAHRVQQHLEYWGKQLQSLEGLW